MDYQRIWEIIAWVTLGVWALAFINYWIARIILNKKGINRSENCSIL